MMPAMLAIAMTVFVGLSGTTGDLKADSYFALTDPSGAYPLGWEHNHREDGAVLYERYTRYPDGAFVFDKRSFRYDKSGRLQSFICSTNWPAEITTDAQVFGDGMAAQVAIKGLSKLVTMSNFSLQEELDLNMWARSAKPGDVHSFKNLDCVKAAIFECKAQAITTSRILVDERELNGLKVGVECPEAQARYIVWFDGEGNELSQLESNVLGVRDE